MMVLSRSYLSLILCRQRENASRCYFREEHEHQYHDDDVLRLVFRALIGASERFSRIVTNEPVISK
jgi:hypothetical protein